MNQPGWPGTILRRFDRVDPIETRADAEAYLSRLAQYPRELDGEVGRIRAARKRGLVPPTFLIDATIKQLGIALKDAQGGGGLVDSLVTRTKAKGIAGEWDSRARRIVTSEVVPALQRQIEEMKAERAVATDIPGMWSRPRAAMESRLRLRS